jgi:hypothetical protein
LFNVPIGKYTITIEQLEGANYPNAAKLVISNQDGLVAPIKTAELEVPSDSGVVFIIAHDPEVLKDPPSWLSAALDRSMHDAGTTGSAVAEIRDTAGSCIGICASTNECVMQGKANWYEDAGFDLYLRVLDEDEED